MTAVCSTRNVELVTRLGADVVIDYSQADWAGTGPFDLILDMVGDQPIETYIGNLTPANLDGAVQDLAVACSMFD